MSVHYRTLMLACRRISYFPAYFIAAHLDTFLIPLTPLHCTKGWGKGWEHRNGKGETLENVHKSAHYPKAFHYFRLLPVIEREDIIIIHFISGGVSSCWSRFFRQNTKQIILPGDLPTQEKWGKCMVHNRR